MKKGWKVERLGDVCDFLNGLWKGKKPPYVNVGVIRNTNFTKDCELDDTDIAYLDVEKSLFTKRKLQYGDIILEKSGGGPKQPVGRVIIFDKEDGNFSFSNFTSVLRIKDKNKLDFRFLQKYLFSAYVSGVTEKMQSHSTGIRNLKFDEYKQISIPLPPLPEQKRIVSLLDECFAALAQVGANAARNQVNAREVFESHLESFFEDPQHTPDGKPLETLCELIVDCEHKTAPIQEDGYPSIRTPNIGRGHFILDGVNRVSEGTYKRWTRRAIPQAGDLIFAREAPAGNVAVIPEDLEPCLGQRTVLIRPNKKVFDPHYLMWLLLSDNIQKFFVHNSKGSTVVHVNMKDIRGLKINNLPPLAEQRRIVQRLDGLARETSRLEEVYRQKVEDVEEMRRSVLRDAFQT